MGFQTQFHDNDCSICKSRSKNHTSYDTIWEFICEYLCKILENHAEAVLLTSEVLKEIVTLDSDVNNLGLYILEETKNSIKGAKSYLIDDFVSNWLCTNIPLGEGFVLKEEYKKKQREILWKYDFLDDSPLTYYMFWECFAASEKSKHTILDQALSSPIVGVNWSIPIDGRYMSLLMGLVREIGLKVRNDIELESKKRLLGTYQYQYDDSEEKKFDELFSAARKSARHNEDDLRSYREHCRGLETFHKQELIIAKREALNYLKRSFNDINLIEDAIGEALLALIHAKTIPDNFSAYIKTASKRILIKEIENRKKARDIINAEKIRLKEGRRMLFQIDKNSFDSDEESRKYSLVEEAIRKLNPHQRKVISDRYFHQKSCKKIAREMNTTIKAIESLLSRARKNIKKTLEDSQVGVALKSNVIVS